MYAIIETGGKQYKVRKDTVIDVERLNSDAGKEVIFHNVLLVSKADEVQVGKPYVTGARVVAEVVRNLKGPKTISFKFRRRKSSHTKVGHRQALSQVKIKEI